MLELIYLKRRSREKGNKTRERYEDAEGREERDAEVLLDLHQFTGYLCCTKLIYRYTIAESKPSLELLPTKFTRAFQLNFKFGLSHSKKNVFICLIENLLKMMENASYFISKALFILYIFVLTFFVKWENGVIKKQD